MIARIIALFEALTVSDLEQGRPTDLELFAALCRHWASLADLSRETRGNLSAACQANDPVDLPDRPARPRVLLSRGEAGIGRSASLSRGARFARQTSSVGREPERGNLFSASMALRARAA